MAAVQSIGWMLRIMSNKKDRGVTMDFTDSMMQDSLPLGLAFGMAMDEKALNHYSRMTEYEKEQLLAKSKSVKSKEEMQQLIQKLRDGDSMM